MNIPGPAAVFSIAGALSWASSCWAQASCSQPGDAAACPAATRSADVPLGPPQDLTPIGSDLRPLIEQFNAEADKPRIVALLSPTCGGCVHGAKALLKEAVVAYPDVAVSVFVVWEPMLPSDSEEEAKKIAGMFTDPRVQQYWDAERLSGITYSRDTFPAAWRELLEVMPKDSPMYPHVERGANAPPERLPLWDFAAFYPAGVRWEDKPPRPERFIRQLAIWKQPDGSTEATLITDSFAKPPVQSDWFDEVRVKTASLLGTQPSTAAAALSSTATPPACCAKPVRTKGAEAATAPGLISLAEDVTPFRERFNQVSDKPRFVAIVSSTCGPCVSGAVSANEAIVKGFADAGIDVSVVWIDVLPSDGAESAARSSTIFDDPRVVQYHDPSQLLGNAFAEGLLERKPAWDIYLFYPAGATWDDSPPKPIDWMHQLGGAGADRSRYKTEVLLAAAMHEAMTQHLGFEAKSAAPTKEQLASARVTATARIGKAACGTPSTDGGQCSRCSASETIGQCSISGWRYIVASRVRDEAGGLTNRFELSGDVNRPVTRGEVDATDTRYDYAIEGMACPDCTTQVAGKVLQVRGVTRVEVDYDHKRLIVFAHDEHGSKLETLPMHLELAGFRVTPVPAPDDD